MRALVTGGTGFIGSHLVEELVRQGYAVTCLARDTSNLQWIESYPVTLVRGDCINTETLKHLFDSFDYVFHLAGLTKALKPEDFYCTNVEGTENLLKVVSRYGSNMRRFVHLSTLAVAGPSPEGVPVNSVTVPSPVSEYGKSKLEAERSVLAYKDQLPITIIRPPAVYGPRDRDFFLFFRMIKSGLFLYWGKAYYSLIYVEDLVKGIIKAAISNKTVNKIYYLSDTEIHSNEEIAKTIAMVLGCRYIKVRIPKNMMPLLAGITQRFMKKAIINLDKVKELKHSYWLCSSAEARADFGFETNVTLLDGIKWTANWYKIHKWL